MKLVLWLCFLTVIQGSMNSEKNKIYSDPTVYTITINQDDPFKVRVHAVFSKNPDTLYIHPGCPNDDYSDGWSTFVRPLDRNLQFLGEAKWILKGNKAEYEIDLSFVNKQWPAGNEQAGTYIEGSIFIVTRALFLYDENDNNFEVNFNLPDIYTIAAPWTTVNQNQFLVNSLESLNNNTLVWGRKVHELISIGDFKLQIALLGYSTEIGKLVNQNFELVLKHYLEIFPKTPPADYLITAFPFEQNDGEAYTTSNAFTLKLPISEDTKLVWTSQFAHELFHFWNGKMINGPERRPRQWFSEGFTEYFANLAVLRMGIVSEEDFFGLIEKTIGLYYYFRIRQYQDISLADAGENKSKYRFGVYNGGWVAAFVMDMMIREKHPGKSLDDFMNALFENHGIAGKPYALKDLESLSSAFLEDDGAFFRKYITGLEILPLEYYMNQLGILVDIIPYEGVTFLIKDSKANMEQKNLRKQWLYGK